MQRGANLACTLFFLFLCHNFCRVVSTNSVFDIHIQWKWFERSTCMHANKHFDLQKPASVCSCCCYLYLLALNRFCGESHSRLSLSLSLLFCQTTTKYMDGAQHIARAYSIKWYNLCMCRCLLCVFYRLKKLTLLLTALLTTGHTQPTTPVPFVDKKKKCV